MASREYPVALTFDEICAINGALLGTDAEYGLSSSFYTPRTLPSGATVEEHRAEARRASDEANEQATALLAKIRSLVETATELEPTS